MLVKTIELPPGDAATARRRFAEAVHNEPFVLLVVLGDDVDASELVERADKVAGAPEDLRYVVWMRNPLNHREQITDLQSSAMLDGKDVLAFCTSFDDLVCDVIERSESPVKFRRIIRAFIRGES
jgi:hypothetical protein